MRTYLPRLIDSELSRASRNMGAVCLKGLRGSGKTTTARRHAKSQVELKASSAAANLVRLDPQMAIKGKRPHLIDEWQAVPAVWNEVRHAVDEEEGKGLFILTGSATPDRDANRHSGAGRIRSLVMRTLSLYERDVPAQRVSLSRIAEGTQEPTAGTQATVRDYANWIVASGFPDIYSAAPLDAQDRLESYIWEMSEHDYPELSGPRRDPRRFQNFVRAYAALIAQPATGAAIRKRIGELSGATSAPAMETVNALHDFATRLFLIEDQPAWSPNMRSKTTMPSSSCVIRAGSASRPSCPTNRPTRPPRTCLPPPPRSTTPTRRSSWSSPPGLLTSARMACGSSRWPRSGLKSRARALRAALGP